MEGYVALLRGINVNGHNIILMADLRQLCREIGLQNVRTYIQSGNILFHSDRPEAELRDQLQSAIMDRFGHHVPVALRTATQMQQIIHTCPFGTDVPKEGESIYISLLVEAPSPEALARMPAHTGPLDEYRILGREVYILCRQPYHKSKLTNQFFEQRLGVPATARNWRTMTKLVELSQ